eukprot:5028561-Pyramimonas_sp.AAC.1
MQLMEQERARKAARGADNAHAHSQFTDHAPVNHNRRQSQFGAHQYARQHSVSAASSENEHLRWQDVSQVRTKRMFKDPVNAVWVKPGMFANVGNAISRGKSAAISDAKSAAE